MSWNDTVLSTNDSIEKYVRNVNNISSTSNWAEKIELAKSKIGRRILANIRMKGYDGLIDLDSVSNPEVFSASSDFLTLHYIFKDLENYDSSAYADDAEYYFRMYIEEIKVAENLYNIDLSSVEIDGFKSQSLINCIR